ncbi:MAG: AsnC family transcriptional regulator, partial [Actinobacteria bacterium]|nr:AsnC family transcriptional regulator [Actinomycetota bacterium]
MEKRLDGQLGAFFPSAWPALLARISEIDEFKGWWVGRFDPPPAYLSGLRKKTIALSAIASVGIDWTGLPLRRDELSPAVSPARAEEIRRASAASYAQLLKAVFDGHPEIPFSREVVLKFHSDLLRYSPHDQGHRGSYRSSSDRSAFFLRKSVESIALRPSDPGSIEAEMDSLLAWTNSRLGVAGFHPLVVVAGFLLEFLAIRPFAAANGRTSRLLTNLLLLRCGYAYLPYASLEKVIADRNAE